MADAFRIESKPIQVMHNFCVNCFTKYLLIKAPIRIIRLIRLEIISD